MSDSTTATVESTIDAYLAAYGEPDTTRRSTLIESVWAVDGHLVDPPLDGKGHVGISEMAAAMLAHFAGHSFRRSTGVDEHHGIARYGWELVAPDGSVTLAGMDVAEFAGDGKLARVAGFFGDLPARDA